MTMGPDLWTEDTPESCEHFQVDLSCLVDGELDELAAARAMVHLEDCPGCRSFMEETQRCVHLNRDISDPDRLLARITSLSGLDLAQEAMGIELVHRLATIFYKLGKAYVLAAIDPDFRTRVFEKAVPVESTQLHGRGFVDGVLEQGREAAGGLDWRHARHMLNGRLERIESPIEKGRKLLNEAIVADPSHEEARLYMAFLHGNEGKTIQASEEYRDIFRTAMSEENRGHAVVQLGRLYESEGNHRRALACFRWVTISGLAEREERFFYVHFNIGLQYALLGGPERSVAAFRRLIDRHPERLSEIAGLFARSETLQTAVDSQPGFGEQLLASCPELFEAPSSDVPDVPE